MGSNLKFDTDAIRVPGVSIRVVVDPRVMVSVLPTMLTD
jgi:hypothetical protein